MKTSPFFEKGAAWTHRALSLRGLIALSTLLFMSAGTGVRPALAESDGVAPIYVGSESCKDCHEKEYKSFITYAKKSRSFQSIERVSRGLNQEELKQCYSCHTTGFGRPGGFKSAEETPHLKNAGCEVCHGPGGLHITTKDPRHIKGALTMRDCEACHISERVKAFRYKPLIHGGAH